VSTEERDETLRVRGLAVNQRRNGYVGDPAAGADGTSDGSGDADSDTDGSANPDAEADDAPDGQTDADGESDETAAPTPDVDATDGDDDGGLSAGVIAAVIGIPLAGAGGWFAGRKKAG
jgi:hypothetical protein